MAQVASFSGSSESSPASLKKGAHILQVEGEIRSREYETKQVGKKPGQKEVRDWEIRVDSILKLDRAELRPARKSNETGDVAEDVPAEEVAA